MKRAAKIITVRAPAPVSVAPGMSTGKTVQMLGGVLAGWWAQTPDQPETLTLGIVNRVVQKTFKIVSRTTAVSP